MRTPISKHFSNWRASPQKWDVRYIASRIAGITKARLHGEQIRHYQDKYLVPPIESEDVNILLDPDFRRSITEVKDLTCLDVARLANLWSLARAVETGVVIEVGVFRGGTARHVCNAIPKDVPFYCFDPFELGGFEGLGPLDTIFKAADFTDTAYERVVKLLSSKPNAKVIQGFFPPAAAELNLDKIALCHLDVDIYAATRDCLEYLAPRLAPKGMIVVDDVGHRETPGVDKALADFLAFHPSFVAFPLFPCQALLLSKDPW